MIGKPIDWDNVPETDVAVPHPADVEILHRAHKTIQDLIEWEIAMGGWEAKAWKDARATYVALRKHLKKDAQS